MGYSFMGLGLLVSLPILVGQWIGIIGLGKATRNMAWKCMLVGISISTLGALASMGMIGLILSAPGSPYASIMYISGAAVGLSGLGSLLFTIGFALHGSQAAKSSQRVAELEAIAAAQGEELNRLRVS